MDPELNNSAPMEQFDDKKQQENKVVESTQNTETTDYSTLSIAELLTEFERLIEAEDKTEMHKNADIIKSCFYKLLRKDQPSENGDPEVATQVQESPEETAFKQLYARYKVLRADLLRSIEQQKERNLEEKLAIIDGIKELLEKQEDINHTFPEFRNLQLHWKEVGPVPITRTKDIWETYQHYVEKFYDYVKINKELRDLDFKRNLEIKEKLCEKAAALVDEPNVVSAFHKLQKLHEEWRETGPIARELREPMWERFKLSTTAINKKHQEYFEEQKKHQRENLEAKLALCEKAEKIVGLIENDEINWNKRAKELEAIQKEWRTIGFATKKENQKVYDRFRAACDKFYGEKREFYAKFKHEMQDNLAQKIALCEQAEAVNMSDDWRRTTDQLIHFQKQWKEIGPVPRKQAEAIWKRFRSACDVFFTRKAEHFSKLESSFEDNLAKKEAILRELESFDPSSVNDLQGALRDFQARWNQIGFVPIKEKDAVQSQYKNLINKHFGHFNPGFSEKRGNVRQAKRRSSESHSEHDKLIVRFRQLESEITVWENNMGFFAKSKNADKIIADTCKKIEEAKAELKALEEKIKQIENNE
ncbi:MAG: DUF349 domain-containing protein [Bacteroidales bacterium]|jgi:hypothetical protein|nr:DUF349 domain-containing protein [Bacteroidales bacterium]MDD2770909.1 DUF349 domain-containing protein [Bacteroidales bacterium]MDD3104773.1 DUF349 domain-containing protein [Bacteroidales bacterium]MDD3549622.1 DUF349 domain-containing protein [Bacteroidales bacterium]MDD4064566.1 DUF349 domain-containing protein [Bacteroidales bacterium]